MVLNETECWSYDSETRICLFAKNMGHFFAGGKPGINCPYSGSVRKCNEEYHSLPWSANLDEKDDQVKAWMRYGFPPGVPVPRDFLYMGGSIIDDLLDGVYIITPEGVRIISSRRAIKH